MFPSLSARHARRVDVEPKRHLSAVFADQEPAQLELVSPKPTDATLRDHIVTDLILWRHAEAEDLEETDEEGGNDLSRRLTPKGERQATRMAAWLDRQLPEGVKVLASPAVRTEQTVLALGRKYKTLQALAPDGHVQALLDAVHWPKPGPAHLVVGHQPVLGQVVAQLLGLQAQDCSVRKGAVWWLRHRVRKGEGQTVLMCVQSPEML